MTATLQALPLWAAYLPIAALATCTYAWGLWRRAQERGVRRG